MCIYIWWYVYIYNIHIYIYIYICIYVHPFPSMFHACSMRCPCSYVRLGPWMGLVGRLWVKDRRNADVRHEVSADLSASQRARDIGEDTWNIYIYMYIYIYWFIYLVIYLFIKCIYIYIHIHICQKRIDVSQTLPSSKHTQRYWKSVVFLGNDVPMIDLPQLVYWRVPIFSGKLRLLYRSCWTDIDVYIYIWIMDFF